MGEFDKNQGQDQGGQNEKPDFNKQQEQQGFEKPDQGQDQGGDFGGKEDAGQGDEGDFGGKPQQQ